MTLVYFFLKLLYFQVSILGKKKAYWCQNLYIYTVATLLYITEAHKALV